MLSLIESSQNLAVSLQKAKSHLRIDHKEEDDNIKLLIQAATTIVEEDIGKSILTKTWQKRAQPEVTREGFCRIRLPFPPLIEVLSVGEIICNTKVRAINRYTVEWESTIPSVLINFGAKNVEVVYKAGFGEKASDIPATIRQAILMLVGEMYEKKSCYEGIQENSLVKTLLNPHRLISLS